jgi:hypothetical protein
VCVGTLPPPPRWEHENRTANDDDDDNVFDGEPDADAHHQGSGRCGRRLAASLPFIRHQIIWLSATT